MSNPFGFAVRAIDDSPVFLPLKSVSVNACIVDVSVQVNLTQVFENASGLGNTAAHYIFPVPANAAVCSFKMETEDGRSVRAVVKELTAARKEYESAVSKGKWAGLLEHLTGDVFVLSVGAIPSGQDVTVCITYVEELAQDELVNQVRFTLPTYIAERYGTPPATHSSLPSAVLSKQASLDIRVNVQMASQIQSINSPSHAIVHTVPTTIKTDRASVYASVVTLSTAAAPPVMDKDYILTVQASDLNKPRCVAEVDHKRNSVAMSLTLVPQFGIPQIDSQEYVFVIDRSGSMAGSRIEYAKDALQILLKSLPTQGTRFNIASFGTKFSFLWNRSQEYTEASLKIAIGLVEDMSADMGGTEIGGVLEAVFKSRANDIPTSVFVLTDGKVWNTSQIFDNVRNAVTVGGDASLGAYLRVFALGIGHAASTNLCRGLARTGNGLCYMVADSSDVPSRCSALLRAARVPPVGNLWGLTIDWGHPDSGATVAAPRGILRINPDTFSFFDETVTQETADSIEDCGDIRPAQLLNSNLVKQAPSTVPDIYPFNRFLVSAILCNTTQIPGAITLKGKTPSGEVINMTFQVQMAESSVLLHTLAARRLISDLQEGNIASLSVSDQDGKVSCQELIKAEVVKLSEEYQIASEFAAFVAVENEPKQPEAMDRELSGQRKEELATERYDMSFFRMRDNAHSEYDTRSISAISDDYGISGVPGRAPYMDSGPVRIKLFQAARRLLSSGPKEEASGFNAKSAVFVEQGETRRSLKAPRRCSGSRDDYRRGARIRAATKDVASDFLCDDDVDSRAFGDADSRSTRPARIAFKIASAGYGGDRVSAPAGSLRSDERRSELDRIDFVLGPGGSALPHSYSTSDEEKAFAGSGNRWKFDSTIGSDIGLSLSKAVDVNKESMQAHGTKLTPVTMAKAQYISGSFSLDDDWALLLVAARRKTEPLTLEDLKNAIPASIVPNPDAGDVWATILAIALLREKMMDRKDEWMGLWEKGKKFVLEKIGDDETLFTKLVDEAVKFV